MLSFRSVEDVFEIHSHRIIAIEIRSGVRFQDERIESAALALLIGEVVVQDA